MRGIGVVRAKPFWADAWHRVVIRHGAQAGLLWIAIIGFFAIFAPLLANGLPLWTKELGPDGEVVRSFSPLFQALTATDLLLIAGGVLGPLLFLIPMGLTRQHKLGLICAAALLGGITVVLIPTMEYTIVGDEVTDLSRAAWFPWALGLGSGFAVGVVLFWMPTFKSMGARIVFALLVGLLSGAVYADRWSAPVLNPERFIRGQEEGTYENTFTLIPWSPDPIPCGLLLQATDGNRRGSVSLRCRRANQRWCRLFCACDHVQYFPARRRNAVDAHDEGRAGLSSVNRGRSRSATAP